MLVRRFGGIPRGYCIVMINITFQCLNYTIFIQTFLSEIIKSMLFEWALRSLEWV